MKSLSLACLLLAGSSGLAADTETKVKVALALADAKPKAKALPKKAALDWFGDACACCKAGTPCTCKRGECGGDGCPGSCEKVSLNDTPTPKTLAKVKEYVTVYEQQCVTDRFGRKTCQWVPRLVEKQ